MDLWIFCGQRFSDLTFFNVELLEEVENDPLSAAFLPASSARYNSLVVLTGPLESGTDAQDLCVLPL